MRIHIIVLVLLLSPCLSYAQVQGAAVSQGLTQGLSALKTSVDQLAVSNEDLAAKNVKLKERLSAVQTTLQKLNNENQELTAAKLKLETPVPAKTKQIEELEKKMTDVDAKGSELSEQIKEAKDKLSSIRNEGEPASEEPSAQSVELVQKKKKEKLTMLKIISESQAHQALLQEQLLDAQKNPPMDVGGSQNLNHKKMLEAQIKQLEQENAQLTDLFDHSAGQGVGEDQMRRLEQSVVDLEKNRNELKGLVIKMQKKAQRVHLTSGQRSEQSKLQYNIDQLKSEAKNLKLDLEESQQQMISDSTLLRTTIK